MLGYYNPTAESNVYYVCPPGSYADDLPGASSCTLASPGNYAPLPASTFNTGYLSCETSLLAGAAVCNSGRVKC